MPKSFQTYPTGTDPHTIPWDAPYKSPPDGQVSNFDHPNYSLRNDIIITLAVTLFVATVATCARFLTRVYIVRRLGWDDYLCFVAYAVVVSFNAAALMRIPHGLGVPTWDQRIVVYFERDEIPFVYWFTVMNVLRHFGLMFLKLSILALYLRIIGNAHALHRKTRWVVIGSMVWVVGYNFGLLGWLLGICDPTSKLFHLEQPGNCRYSGLWKELSAWSAINVFTDFLIFFTPLPMIWQLQFALSQKIATVITLATGLMVCAATTVNLVISIKIIRQESTEDPLQLWAIIEMNIGMIVVCLPAMKQLFFRALKSRSKASSAKGMDASDESKSGRLGRRLGGSNDPDLESTSNIILTQEMKQVEEQNTRLHKPVRSLNGDNCGLQGYGYAFADVGETPRHMPNANIDKDSDVGMSTIVYTK